MNCLIVDDDIICRTVIKHLVTFEESLNLVAECKDANEAYRCLDSHKIDLIFLDVEMPGISGIELVKGLGQSKPLIIFISSKKDYAAEAFDLNVVDFITKPVAPDRFLRSVIKAKDIYKHKNNSFFLGSQKDEFIFIRDSSVIRRVKLNDICYLEAQGDYVKIYLIDRVHSIHSSLKSVEDKLPADTFSRVHRSFIVNLSKIDTIEGSTLVINKNFVPVSDAYRSALNKRMQIL